MKNQEEKKESVLGAIEKYKAEEKAKPIEKKESSKGTERQNMSVWSSDRTDYFFVKLVREKRIKVYYKYWFCGIIELV